MQLTESDSFIDIKPNWMELNRTYKSGELSVDWGLHYQLWEQFYKNKNYTLKILIGIENGRCVGILPLKYQYPGNELQSGWIVGEESIIAREYFSPPDKIHQFLPYLPQNLPTDLSCFYAPRESRFFTKNPGRIIDIKTTEEDYFQSITKKRRGTFKRNLRDNDDIVVKFSHKIEKKEITDLTEKYINYWLFKNALNGKLLEVDSREKIEMDLVLLQRAEELGKLIALYFYHQDKLVAVNFSVRREQDRVDDYLCLRDTDGQYVHRGLGIFAILKNMEYCRQLGIHYYDLSDFAADYKNKFVNTEMYYSVPNTAEIIPDALAISLDNMLLLQQELLQEVAE